MLDVKKWIAKMSTTVLVGEIKPYAGNSEPTGWLKCDGRAISRINYAALFDVIGTTYGAGDGSTTFNLPDMRDRFPVGSGSSYALGDTGGSPDAIVPYHNHSFTNPKVTGGATTASKDGGHSHSFVRAAVKSGTGSSIYSAQTSGTTSNYATSVHAGHTHPVPAHTHTVSGGSVGYAGTNGNTRNANLPPYIGINFIIYAGV